MYTRIYVCFGYFVDAESIKRKAHIKTKMSLANSNNNNNNICMYVYIYI